MLLSATSVSYVHYFSVDSWDEIDHRVRQNSSKTTLCTSEMCSKMNRNPKMNPFQKAFEKITEIMEPSFEKIIFLQKIQNTGYFHKLSRTTQ